MRYGEEKIREAVLESWPNPSPERDYLIEITFPEFTCLCPRSGYPDFATIQIRYVPAEYIVELKSLKLYLNSFRDEYISHEEATNTIFSRIKETICRYGGRPKAVPWDKRDRRKPPFSDFLMGYNLQNFLEKFGLEHGGLPLFTRW